MKTTRMLFVLLLGFAFAVGSAPVPAVRGPGEPRALADASAGAVTDWPVVRVEPRHDSSTPAADGLPRREPAPTGRPAPQPERVRELPEMRTATARFFELSDGRVQAEVSSTPTHYQDGKGNWRPIDTGVRDAEAPGFVLGNETNQFVSLFGDRSDRLARVEYKGRQITLGTAGSPRELTPQADGDAVTFADTFGADLGAADLVYRVATDALKEEIVLERAPTAAVPAYTFTLQLGGVEAVERADGSIYFLPKGAGRGERPLFVIPKPFMVDAADDVSSPYGKAWSDEVTQTVTQRGSQVEITIRPDGDWLTSVDRQYPVVIDPTIVIEPTPTQGQDAMIRSASPSTSYGSSWQLGVGTDGSGVARSLVRFDVSWLPAGTPVDSAELRMWYDQAYYTNANAVEIRAHRVTSSWSESSVTWSNFSGGDGEQAYAREQVDNGDAGKVAVNGSWPSSTSTLTQYAVNQDYQYNKNDTPGETFTWVPRLAEPGDYQVEAHYVRASDRSTAAPYTIYYSGGQQTVTVDQTSGATPGVWADLGTKPFVAGTSHQGVLGDSPASSSTAVVADAVRLTKWASDTKDVFVNSVWHSFAVRDLVQQWVDGQVPNYGFMLRAANESTLGRGGAYYEAAEYAYQGGTANRPKLVITYGRPSVQLDPLTTIYATGGELHWSGYVDPSPAGGDDIVEYQVHRAVYQRFTPSAATLVAPVPAGTTTFTDTTAEPTPADDPDPFGNAFYYMVAVKTRDGSLVPSSTRLVRLPKAGRVTRIVQGTAVDTTISADHPTTSYDVFDGEPWLGVGDNGGSYGVTRTLIKFPNLQGVVPAGATVLDADLEVWKPLTFGSGAVFDLHRLTRGFDETTATWNQASSGTPWTTPGGDYDPAIVDYIPSMNSEPKWHEWWIDTLVQQWVDTPSSNNGALIKVRDESSPSQLSVLDSTELASEPLHRPKLRITYLEKTAESTYYAPGTPEVAATSTVETVDVTVTNTTASTITAASTVLSYHWALPDGTDITSGANRLETALPEDLSPGETITVAAQLKTPAVSTPGNKREAVIPRWDLLNTSTGQWLSDTAGIPPLEQAVAVQEPTSGELGLEDFYQYAAQPTGAGSSVLTNLHSGNLVFSYDPLSVPSRGPESFLRLTYNSLDTSQTPGGYGWSVSASTLMRLGTPLQFHPPGQTWPTEITLTDGDGTTHTFTLNTHGSPDPEVWDYDHPAGVHLYLQKTGSGDDSRAWVATSPDRTRFYFDTDGYQSAIVDGNGNELLFTYEQRRSANTPVKFLRYLTDAAGRETLTIGYYRKGQDYAYVDDTGARVTGSNLTNPAIIDKIESITDISGRKLTFTYTDKGLLAELVDGAGDPQAKTFRFGYDMTQGNKNVKLVAVTDPRGNTTNLAYYDLPGDDPAFHWWAKQVTDRAGQPTSVGYEDPDGPQGGQIRATVTDANAHAGRYLMDGLGRPVQAVNANGETTTLVWDGDHNVTRLVEDNGAATTWTYDPNTGYPLTITDAQATADGTPGTTLTYQTTLNGFVADLVGKTSPQGRTWAFGYDPVGNLTSVVDPAGVVTPEPGDYTTTYAYDGVGQLVTATDANGHATSYLGYHPSGYPQQVVDAVGNTTGFTYDDRGNILSATDALEKTSTYEYDVFGRPGESRVPKDQAAGEYVVTPAPGYDRNDNVAVATAPNGAVTSNIFDAQDRPTATLLPPDTPGGAERRVSYEYDPVGNLAARVEPNGTATPADPGDFRTTYAYDPVDQVVSVTGADAGVTSYAYDTVGNPVTVVDPRKNQTADPADYTALFGYDLAHRRTSVTDAEGNVASTGYDRDGLVTSVTDRQAATTQLVLDVRGLVAEQQVPHLDTGGSVTYRVTRFEYDQVGNRTRVITPRGAETPTVADDFVYETVYDALNRVAEQRLPYDPGDPTYNTPDSTFYTYDQVGNLAAVSAPPSAGQSVRNTTEYTYFDNGWVKTSSDPWNILTGYDYNPLGLQTLRTLTPVGEDQSARTMTWAYHPDGKLAARGDDGVPAGRPIVLADNTDVANVETTGSWPASPGGADAWGLDYQSNAAGTGADTFTWALRIPRDGTYQVFVRYPQVTGAATDATYTIGHSGGATPVTVDQTTNAGQWVSLGSFGFTDGGTHQVTLTDDATGTVVADAVKLVRDSSGEADTEGHTLGYAYDRNGNLTTITDSSSDALVDTYLVGYDGLNRVTTVEERNGATVKNTTTYSYDPNGNPETRGHDDQDAAYTWDARDLLASVSVTEPGQAAKTTSYTHTPNGWTSRETKGNGNTVDYTYTLDGLLAAQVEKKADQTLVADHQLTYTPNGHKTSDVSRVMDADQHNKVLDVTTTYTYDPRDRLATLTKTDTSNGQTLGAESYTHDANNNVTAQVIDGVATSFGYDRNRLQSSSSGGVTSGFNYDPYGRLDTVVAAGLVVESYRYDGFDRTTRHTSTESGTPATTAYTYDPLDRTASRTQDPGGPGEQTTAFAYLGLSEQLITETDPATRQLQRSYQYSPAGQRLSQVTHDPATGTGEDSFYGYTPHTDVETLTTPAGDTRATYAYTAYGSNHTALFTGVDTPDPADPDAEPYNFYRYTAKRFDPSTGDYDMGFRDYNPQLNRFLARDTYNGALNDLNLGTSPWTGNRYAFTAGNPISFIDRDGHITAGEGGGCGAGAYQQACQNDTPATSTGTGPPLTQPFGDYLSLGTSSSVKGQLTLENIFNNPEILRGVSPDRVYSLLRESLPPGYVFERPGKGKSKGIGLVIRQYKTTTSGELKPGEALVKWQPGGSSAHPNPYWNVTTPQGKKTTDIVGAPSKTWSKPGTVTEITAAKRLELLPRSQVLPGVAAGVLLAESYQVGRYVDECGWACASYYLFGPELWAELYLPEGCVDPQCMA